jgi:hypothetical protein
LAKKRPKRVKAARLAAPRYSARAQIGVGVVLVLAVLATWNYYRVASAYARAYPDEFMVGLQQSRLRELDAELPRDGTLGYVTDLTHESNEESTAFLGALYLLAPRMLIRADHPLKPELILGNFFRPVDPAQYAAAHHLRVVKVYNPGVVLFRREGP